MKRSFFLFLILILVLQGCSPATGAMSDTAEPVQASQETAAEPEEEEYDAAALRRAEEEALMNDSYLLEELDTREERIILKSLTTGRRYRFAYGLATQFLDKWGNRTSQTSFVKGSIVNIGKAADNVLSSISLSKDAWIVEDLTNFTYDGDKELFKIGNTNYRIRPSVNVFSGSLTVTMEDVTENDHLRVVGLDREVVSVTVTTGHGYIALMNTDFFKDSMIAIGSKIYATVKGDTVVPVSAGKYKITVAKDGYGGSTRIRVHKNETVTVDLSTLKGNGPKKCNLLLKTSIDGVKAYIDGKKVKCNKRFEIAYGQHRLRVEVPDYETWQKTLQVNSSKASISLDPEGYKKKEASASQKSNAGSDGQSGSGSTDTSNSTNSNSSSSGSNTNRTTTNSGTNSGSSSNQSSNRSNGTQSNSSRSSASGSSSDGDDDVDEEPASNGRNNSNTYRSGNYSGDSYGRNDDNDDGQSEGTTSGSRSSRNQSDSTGSARQAELDYLDTLSNMITELTGSD